MATTTFFKAPRYVLRKRNILHRLKGYPDVATFLDIGCGAGELDCTLAERGLAGTGLDFSEAAIKLAKTQRKERHIDAGQLVFKTGGLEQVGNQQFDLVMCCEVLEHVQDDAQLLHELADHSRKYVLVSVPAKQKLFDASDTAVGHYRRYEKAQLRHLLEAEGLDIITLINYGYPFTNAVRLARKAAFARKQRRTAGDSMASRSKESGINPVKLPTPLQQLDLEQLFVPFYHVSRLFNRRDLGEGYLAFCRKPVKN